MYKLARFAYNKTRGSSDTSPKPQAPKRSCQHQWRPLSGTSAGEAGESGITQVEVSQVHDQAHSSSRLQQNGDQCAICQKQKHDLRVYRWKLIAGLFLPDILSTLDLTIVATASPFIASHFRTSCPRQDIQADFTFCRQIRPTQLDRHRVHIDINGFHTCLWSTSRRIWTPCCTPAGDVPDARREHPLCSCADLGYAVAWSGLAGDFLGGYHEYHHDYPGGQGAS